MTALPTSSGTTALTTALKEVFHIHKDVVAELKSKLDTLLHENERLKLLSQKVSPREADKCESCAHLRELNRNLQENFNSRLKDKNAIIKHLEKRLKAAGEEDDSLYTEDVPLCLEDITTDNVNASNSSTFVSEDHANLQDLSPSRGTSCSSRQNTRLRLLRDGRKRSRYVEEPPEAKRQKISPIKTNDSYTTSPSRNVVSSTKENSASSKTISQSNGVLAKAVEKKSNETRLFPMETELSLPVENPSARSSEEAKKSKSYDEFDYGTTGSNLDAKSKYVVIPETLGLDYDEENTQNSCEDDDYNDHDSSTLQEITKHDKQYNSVEKDDRRIDGVSTPYVVPDATIEATLSTTSPSIFRDAHKKRLEGETPRSAPPMSDGEGRMNAFMSGSPRSQRKTSNKNISLPHSVSALSKRGLRQATLTQTFENNSSPRTKLKNNNFSKISTKCDDEQVQAAIKASLQEPFFVIGKNNERNEALEQQRKSETSSFKVPLSPVSLYPREDSLKVNDDDLEAEAKSNLGHGTRRSPRLSKLSKSHSERLSSERRENARKNLFEDAAIENHSYNQETEEPVVQRSPKEKRKPVSSINNYKQNLLETESALQEDPFQDQMHTSECQRGSGGCSVDHAFRKGRQIRKDPMGRSPNQKGKDPMGRSPNHKGKDPMGRSLNHKGKDPMGRSPNHKGKASEQPCAFNGSLNPDIQLSLYFGTETQRESIGSQQQSIDLNETVAPNLVVGDKCLDPARETNKKLESPSIVSVKDGADFASSDREDNDDGEEIIPPSPQENSVLSFHSQMQSLPSTSIPSSSRSYKFTRKTRGIADEGKVSDESTRSLKDSFTKSSHGDNDRSSRQLDVPIVNSKGNDETARIVGKRKSSMATGEDRHIPSGLCNDSFDVLPKKPEEFPHVQVVRKKSEKDKLQGFSCRQCYEYYKDLNLSEKELKDRMQICSRHKQKYQAPSTPQHFWSLSIPDTAEMEEEEQNAIPLGLPKGPRRRRRLEKRFKSRYEEEEKHF